MASLRRSERFFYKRIAPFLIKFRFVFIGLFLLIPALSLYGAYANLEIKTGTITVFLEEHNIGRLETLLKTTFATMADEDLAEAMEEFPAVEAVEVQTCPGADEKGQNSCSGHGECNEVSYSCACVRGWVGEDCGTVQAFGTLDLSENTVQEVVLLNVDGSATEDLVPRVVQILNNGDEIVPFEATQPKESWYRAAPLAGITRGRTVGKKNTTGTPGETDVQITFDITGKEVGFSGSDAIFFSSTMEGIEPKPLEVKLFIMGIPDIVSLKLEGEVEKENLVMKGEINPPFTSTQRAYSCAVKYKVDKVRIVPEFDLPVDSVVVELLNNKYKPEGSGDAEIEDIFEEEPRVSLTSFVNSTGLASDWIPIGEEPISIDVFAHVNAKGVRGMYRFSVAKEVPTKPSAPTLLQALVGNGESTVVFEEPADDGGSVISGYQLTATPTGSRRLQTGSSSARRLAETKTLFSERGDVCTKGACSVKGAQPDAQSCCTQKVTGLENGAEYVIDVTARNHLGDGDLSTPRMGETWKWQPVKPSPVAPTPALTGPAVNMGAGKYHGFVVLAVPWESMNSGGTMPVGPLSCSSTPGGFTGQSGSAPTDGVICKPNEVRINGLDPSTSYDFVCQFEDAEGKVATSPGLPSPIIPYVPPPDIPAILVVTAVSASPPWKKDGKRPGSVTLKPVAIKTPTSGSTSSSVAAIEAPPPTGFKCTAQPGGSAVDSIETSAETQWATGDTIPAEFTVNMTGLDPAVRYTFQCTSWNDAIGRDPVRTYSSLSNTKYSPPLPPTLDTIAPSDGQLAVRFTASMTDPGGLPDSYTCGVVYPASFASQATPTIIEASKRFQAVVISGLVNGDSYRVACTATRDGQEGGMSAESELAMVGTEPAAPTWPTDSLYAGNDPFKPSIQINIEANNQKKPYVTRFDCKVEEIEPPHPANVNSTEVGRSNFTSLEKVDQVENGKGSLWITNLTIGKTYTFSCTATNALGTSKPSVVSAGIFMATNPAPPTNIVVQNGESSKISVSFSAGHTDGGYSIKQYKCRSKADNRLYSGYEDVNPKSPVVITGLTDGAEYLVSCRAENSAPGGSRHSSWSSPDVAATVGTKPTPPDHLQTPIVEGQTGEVIVKINKVNHQPEVTDYTCYANDTANTSGTVETTNCGGNFYSTYCNVPMKNLPVGIGVGFQCVAENAVGISNRSAMSRGVVPRSPPGPPTNIKASPAGLETISITFNPPLTDGGSAITWCECSSEGQTGTWHNPGTEQNFTGDVVLDGLKNGDVVQVICKCKNGFEIVGPTSEAISTMVGIPPPRPLIADLEVHPETGNVIISVAKLVDHTPQATKLRCTARGPSYTPTGDSEQEADVTGYSDPEVVLMVGLPVGQRLSFTCMAINVIGASEPSGASPEVELIVNPAKPLNVVATRAGSGKLDVSFLPGEHDGGKPVYEYKCEASVSERVEEKIYGAKSPLKIQGLKNGQLYSVACYAISEVGTSKPGWGDQIAPATAPPAPVVSTPVVTGDRQLTMEVDSPDGDGGTTIIGYICTAVESQAHTGTSNTSSVVVEDLVPGTSYSFGCTAENAVGISAASEPSTAVHGPGLPMAPEILNLAPGDRKVVAEVGPLTSLEMRGWTAVLRYDCGALEKSEFFSSTPPTTQVSIEGLTNGESIRIVCRSVSEAGIGDWSAPADAIMPGVGVSTAIQLDGAAADLTEEELRLKIAQELGVDPSAIVIMSSSEEGRRLEVSPLGVKRERRLQTSKTVKFKVMRADDEAAAGVRDDINALASSDSFRASVGANQVQVTKRPMVASATFTDSSLKNLEIRSGAEGTTSSRWAVDTLVPPFDPEITMYEVNVSGLEFKVFAEGNSSYALVQTSLNALRITAAAPAQRLVDTRSIAGDMTSTTYTIKVQFQPLYCGNCNNGTCDILRGNCVCDTGYVGDSCDRYCPGDLVCSGKGICSNETKKCECDSTFSWDDCSFRVCPECLNGGRCVPGNQTFSSVWSCDCGLEYQGEFCFDRRCPKDCSEAGECNILTGECTCEEGYIGRDCGLKKPYKEPIINTVEVTLVWGILGYSEKNKSKPEYDPEFDFFNPEVQNYMVSVCDAARDITELLVRPEVPCWIESFKSAMIAAGVGFPVSPVLLPSALDAFFYDKLVEAKFGKDIGTEEYRYSGKVKYAMVKMRVDEAATSGFQVLEPHHSRWVDFLDKINKLTPRSAGKAIMVSESWTKMTVEGNILRSTFLAFFISCTICFTSIVLFTGNVLISLYTLLAIVLIVATLMGFLLGVLGFKFGPIEAIGVTIFVGMSVDYCLHIAHGYHHSEHQNRSEKVRDTLVHLGVSIVSAGFTTGGSTLFLLGCRIYLFWQLGAMMCANTVFALIFTFFFLCPVLIVAGPTELWGDLIAIITCRCHKPASSSPGSPTSSKATSAVPTSAVPQENRDSWSAEPRVYGAQATGWTPGTSGDGPLGSPRPAEESGPGVVRSGSRAEVEGATRRGASNLSEDNPNMESE